MTESLNFLDPQKALKQLDLREDMIGCDFGSGAGGWIIPLAKILRKGRVYALDVQEEMISAMKSRAELERVFNIETIICDLENPKGSGLKDNFADVIIMSNILFQVEEKEEVLKEAARVLRKGGEVLVADWRKETVLGPKQGRVSPEEVKEMAADAGLRLKKEFDAEGYHFGLIFTK